MKILLMLFFITGFVFLTSFLIGSIFVFGQNSSPKLKGAYSIFLAVNLSFYLAASFFVFAGGIIFKTPSYLPYIIFALLPFVIGKMSNYPRLKFYAALQILVVAAGCASSFLDLIGR